MEEEGLGEGVEEEGEGADSVMITTITRMITTTMMITTMMMMTITMVSRKLC